MAKTIRVIESRTSAALDLARIATGGPTGGGGSSLPNHALYAVLAGSNVFTNTNVFEQDITFEKTVIGYQIHAKGQIMSSGAALQVNGFMRTGAIYIHSGGNIPNITRSADALTNSDAGDLMWRNNKVWTTANSNRLDANWTTKGLTAHSDITIQSGNNLRLRNPDDSSFIYIKNTGLHDLRGLSVRYTSTGLDVFSMNNKGDVGLGTGSQLAKLHIIQEESRQALLIKTHLGQMGIIGSGSDGVELLFKLKDGTHTASMWNNGGSNETIGFDIKHNSGNYNFRINGVSKATLNTSGLEVFANTVVDGTLTTNGSTFSNGAVHMSNENNLYFRNATNTAYQEALRFTGTDDLVVGSGSVTTHIRTAGVTRGVFSLLGLGITGSLTTTQNIVATANITGSLLRANNGFSTYNGTVNNSIYTPNNTGNTELTIKGNSYTHKVHFSDNYNNGTEYATLSGGHVGTAKLELRKHDSIENGSQLLKKSTYGSDSAVIDGTATIKGALHLNDENTSLTQASSNGALKVITPTGYVTIGSESSGYVHIQTDRARFYMNKPLDLNGRLTIHNHNTYLEGRSLMLDTGHYLTSTGTGIKHYGDTMHEGYVGSSSYISGITGTGWRISPNANAELSNLDIREGLTCNTFTNNKINISNGDLIVSDHDEIEYIGGNDNAYLYFSSNQPFRVGDLIRCQGSKKAGNIKSYYVTVNTIGVSQTFKDKDGNFRPFVSFLIADKTGTGIPEIGDVLVRWNSSDVARKGLLYLSSSSTYSPFYDVVYDGVTRARFGNMEGITDSELGNLTGFGLYAENAYLKGKIVAKSGSIGGWNIEGNSIKSVDGITELRANGEGFTNGLIVRKSVGSGTDYIRINYTSATNWGILGKNNDSTTFQLGNYNQIAGWKFDGSKLYSGNIEMHKDGYIRNTSDKWRLNSDGSGALASGSMAWDALGKITFASTVTLNWTSIVGSDSVNSAIITAQDRADDAHTLAGTKTTAEEATQITKDTVTTTFVNALSIDAGAIKTGYLSALRIEADSIGANKIKTSELVVGDNIVMGANAVIKWSQVSDTAAITNTITTAQTAANLGITNAGLAQTAANSASTLAGSKITGDQATQITKDTVTVAYINAFALTATKGTIGGWTITESDMSATSAGGSMTMSTSGYPRIKVAKDDSNRVQMYYYSDADWGISGKKSGDLIFQLGNVNKIAGWTFSSGSLSSNDIYISSASGYIQNWTTAGGIKWRFAGDGSGLLASGAISWTAAGVLNVNRITATDGTIGGFNIDSSYMWTGTKRTSNGYASSGITLAKTGAIYAKEFALWSDGSAHFKGVLDAPSGTIGGFTISSTSINNIGTSTNGIEISGTQIRIRNEQAIPYSPIEIRFESGTGAKLGGFEAFGNQMYIRSTNKLSIEAPLVGFSGAFSITPKVVTGQTSDAGGTALNCDLNSTFVVGHSTARSFYKMTGGADGQIVTIINRNDVETIYIDGLIGGTDNYPLTGGSVLVLQKINATRYETTAYDDAWFILAKTDNNW